MLLNLRKKTWESTMTVGSFSERSSTNNEKLKSMVSFSEEYRKQTHDRLVGGSKTPKSLEAGKIDPKKRLLTNFSELVQSNIIDCLDAMLNTLQFTTNTPQSTQT
jgi:26S proteasome regulatory subunit N11